MPTNNETLKKAKEFFSHVEEGSKIFQNIPDKQLSEKIKKIGESAKEVVKHITERAEI